MMRDCGFGKGSCAKVPRPGSIPAAAPGASAPMQERAEPQSGSAICGGTRVGQALLLRSRTIETPGRGQRRMDRWPGGRAPVLQVAKHPFDVVPVFRRIQETMFSTASACRHAVRINHSALAQMCAGSSSSAMPGWHSCDLTKFSGAFRRFCYVCFPVPPCSAMPSAISCASSWRSRVFSAHRRPGWRVSRKDRS